MELSMHLQGLELKMEAIPRSYRDLKWVKDLEIYCFTAWVGDFLLCYCEHIHPWNLFSVYMGKPSVSLLGRGGGWEKLDISQDAIQIRMSSFNTCFWHYSGVAWHLYLDNTKSVPSSQKHFLFYLSCLTCRNQFIWRHLFL